jgi:hypothetical protein
MKTVELYARVRHAVLIEGISERAAADRFGINARTVSKMLKFSVPPGYVRRKPPFRLKLDEFTGVIDKIPATDRDRPKKQRHTSKQILERLRDGHGFPGKITIMKDYVAGWCQRTQEMFVPLVHPPGHSMILVALACDAGFSVSYFRWFPNAPFMFPAFWFSHAENRAGFFDTRAQVQMPPPSPEYTSLSMRHPWRPC